MHILEIIGFPYSSVSRYSNLDEFLHWSGLKPSSIYLIGNSSPKSPNALTNHGNEVDVKGEIDVFDGIGRYLANPSSSCVI